MKKFFNEFKKFISRGNVMDMAVGIIIGGAFTSIVTSLVNDIINPILGVFGGMNFDQLSVKLTAVVNFLIMALIVFCIVKAMNAAGERFGRKEEKKPDTKECPYCKSKIAIAATRCPNCTSMLNTADESEK